MLLPRHLSHERRLRYNLIWDQHAGKSSMIHFKHDSQL